MSSIYDTESDSEDGLRDLDHNFLTKIFKTLEQIKTPNAFAYSTVDSSLPNPVLHVLPHGLLGLPLWPDHAQFIISQAKQSPLRIEEDMLVNTAGRKSWELNPNHFSIKNPSWNKAIETIVDTITTELSLTKKMGKVSAKLRKLVLYEPGAFSKPHKVSENVPGMFATLVVCLPSPHKGGKLVITVDGEKHEFETASSSDYGCSYAAWFAGITHELLPVVSGYRLMLVYNLIWQSDFEIPSYVSVREHVKQLTTLLEEYNLRLTEGDKELPPILLYELKHKYTQANLNLSTLNPPDFALVQTLQQLSTDLSFDIYLATLVLEVWKEDDRIDDWSREERSQELENVVELDGAFVADSLHYPYGALIDPKGQKEAVADKEQHYQSDKEYESPSAIYWYRDTVVVLVPPSKQLKFMFKLKSDGSVIEPLFRKQLQELSADPAQKPKLEKLCELALKWKADYFFHPLRFSETIPPYFQQAVATAFDLGRIDFFDNACKTTKDKIVLDHACALGRWAAENGVTTMTDRLMKGVRIAPSVVEKVEFLKSVAEGFEAAVPKPCSVERESLKQWSDGAIFTAAAELEILREDDVVSLVQLCKTMEWSLFEENITPVVLNAVTVRKLTFIDELMSTLQPKVDEKQRSFVEMIICNIWNEFAFDANCCKSSSRRYFSFLRHQRRSDPDNEADIVNNILCIVETTITVLSPECLETTVIPAMFTAIPVAPKKRSEELFIPLVGMILKNELAGFRLPNDAVPPSSHKRLVQALLTKFLLDNVSREPEAPTNWSVPTRSCACSDCSVVNRFLQDPHQVSFDYQCLERQRKHLNETFNDRSRSFYDFTTVRVRGRTPVWRITKHRRGYESAKSEWIENTKSAVQTLSKLEKHEPVSGRLEAYLERYYSVIMNANVKELPDLNSLIAMPQLLENSKNAASVQNRLAKQGLEEEQQPSRR